MVGALSEARGKYCRCSAKPAVGSARCWRLALLAIVTLVVGQLLLYHVGSTSYYTSHWPALTYYSSRLTWFQSPMEALSFGGLSGNGRFLNIEEWETEEHYATLLVDAAVQGAGGDDGENGTEHRARHPCPDYPPGLLGRVKVDWNPPSMEKQERTHPELALGGHYRPGNCTARHKVAIIIPYRDRRSHLTALVHHLHPFLQRQQIEYNIYVVEQAGNTPFNRGMLMNVGFVEALKRYPFDCIILHDVDLVPEDDRNLYTCSQPPRHMSASISSHEYKLMYENYFGGVSAVTAAQFTAINGFSNAFWGWGGEDDDLFNRVKHERFNISRYPAEVGRYTMLMHKKAKPNPSRFRTLRKGQRNIKKNGLNNLKYQILKTERRHLFTWMLVALPRH